MYDEFMHAPREMTTIARTSGSVSPVRAWVKAAKSPEAPDASGTVKHPVQYMCDKTMVTKRIPEAHAAS